MSQEFARVRERAVEIAIYEMSQDVQEVGSENRGPNVDRYATRGSVLQRESQAVTGVGFLFIGVIPKLPGFMDRHYHFIATTCGQDNVFFGGHMQMRPQWSSLAILSRAISTLLLTIISVWR